MVTETKKSETVDKGRGGGRGATVQAIFSNRHIHSMNRSLGHSSDLCS